MSVSLFEIRCLNSKWSISKNVLGLRSIQDRSVKHLLTSDRFQRVAWSRCRRRRRICKRASVASFLKVSWNLKRTIFQATPCSRRLSTNASSSSAWGSRRPRPGARGLGGILTALGAIMLRIPSGWGWMCTGVVSNDPEDERLVRLYALCDGLSSWAIIWYELPIGEL